jgi:hypothetical protein
MATCPKCGEYLGANHRCWGLRRQLHALGFSAAGGLAGLLVVFLVSDRPSLPLLLVTALLGGILTLAVRRYARF